MAFLTVFATMLVVAGHCDMTADYKQTWIFKWVYSFHMPLFFLISGYLFCLTNSFQRLNNTNWTDFMKKKFVRLMIPFFVINSVIFLMKATLFSNGDMLQNPVELSAVSYLNHLLLYPIGFMWFLPCLFMIFLMAFPLWKHCKKMIGSSNGHLNWKYLGGGNLLLISVLILAVSFSVDYYERDFIQFMQLSRALYYLLFFWIGILYCEYSDIVNRFIKKYWPIILCVSLATSVLQIGNSWMLTFAGITLSITIGLLFSDALPSVVLEMSAFTYTIYLLSYFPQMFVRGPVFHMFPTVNQYWFSALSFLLGITVPILFSIAYNFSQKQIPHLSKYNHIFGI